MRVMSTSPLVHVMHAAAQFPGHALFKRALADVTSAQDEVLKHLLDLAARTEVGRRRGIHRTWTARTVAERLPVTTWPDWAAWVDLQRAGRDRPVMGHSCTRFEPTSGSTASRKWIPYPPAQLRQLDRAASAWLFDIARTYPRVLRGRHYWSLSWIPDDLRSPDSGAAATGDDLELLPGWKRILLSRVMAVPPDVARRPSVDETMFETLVALCAATDLSLVSVWSPTFLLELLRRLGSEREHVAHRMEGMGQPRRAHLLRSWNGSSDAGFFRTFWPDLALVSAWDTGSSASFAAEVKALLPHAAFQGKGVWATEGVITIPFAGRYPLAVRSHYYEFRCLTTGKMLRPRELEPDMEVQPVISTGSGLWRYALEDRLVVTGFVGTAPCLRFVARLNGTDLVGEKLDAALALSVLERVGSRLGIQCVTLLARQPAAGSDALPQYVLLGRGDSAGESRAAAAAEEALAGIHHYALARQLGQLGPAQAMLVADPLATYGALARTNKASGSTKIDPVCVWKE